MGHHHTAISGDANTIGDHDAATVAENAVILYPSTPQEARPLFTLPPDLPTFTGRDDLLEALDGLLQPGGQATVGIVSARGLAGVGKSALAIHAAHRWRDRFPDGVAWMDLRAEAGASEALRHVAGLYGYQGQAAQIDDVHNLAVLVRMILRDKRVLWILDNAEGLSADELDCMLPGVPGPVTVVTSRRAYPALERLGQQLRVDVMGEREALALLARLVGREEREPYRRLAARLGHLPLALDIAGRCMRDRGWGPDEVLRRLEEVAGRPTTLPLPITGEPEDSVAQAFTLSYDGLDVEDQELFRALSPFAPTGFTPRAVGVVLGREDVAGVEAGLERLRALHLARRAAIAGRYDQHPLLRDCALALAERAGEREHWAKWHTRYFAARADLIGRQLGDPETAPQAVAVATTDRGNLLAAQQTSLAQGFWGEAVSLAYRLDDLFKRSGHWADRRRALEAGIEAARKGGLRPDEVGLAHNLGLMAQGQGDYAVAQQLYGEALDIAQQLGDRASVAVTLHNLGMLAQNQGDHAEARRLHQQAARTFERLGDRVGVARTLHQLGNVAYQQGDYAEARRQYGVSIDIAQQLGDHAGVASTTSQMGMLAYLHGKVKQARRLYEKSLAIRKKMGDRKGIATNLHQLGVLAQDQGDNHEARRRFREYLDVVQQLGDYASIAQTLHQLGRLAEEDGDLEEAERLFAESLFRLEALDSPDAPITRRSLERVRGRMAG
ncbi:MAG TPA: tetratricopeptide repeat protein [Anaerolineae bacterium]|nr:tetratricopeptide repeat protein [Anaerolineae bacterium]